MTSGFSFTNTAELQVNIKPVDLKPVSQYAKAEDTSTSCELKNKTAALGQGELLSYQCTNIDKVSTKQPILNPAKVTSGVQYIARLDEILRTSDDAGNIVCDDPIVMYLTVRHTNSSYITPDMITQVFKRLCGALVREDGTYRFDDLMLSALAPIKD